VLRPLPSKAAVFDFLFFRVWNVQSPSGKMRAIVRKGKGKKGEDKQFIEVRYDFLALHCSEAEFILYAVDFSDLE
jgi:hypothetical protein